MSGYAKHVAILTISSLPQQASDVNGEKAPSIGPQPALPMENENDSLSSKRSLTPVLTRFQSLRNAVEKAVSAHNSMVQKAEKEESDVSTQERIALVEKRNILVEEVRIKNEKIKILIDQLRELHRDIVILLASYYKARTNQGRKS